MQALSIIRWFPKPAVSPPDMGMNAGDGQDRTDETLLLLDRIRSGDAEALQALVVRDLDWIHSYVHRHLDGVVRRHADTHDVVQEIVIRVLKHGPRFDVPGRETFRRMMGRIALNTLTSLARRYNAGSRSAGHERRFESDSALYLQDDSPRRAVTEPPDRAAKVEETDRIRLAMELCSARDQAILRQRDWEGLPFKEAGEHLGLTEDAARMCYKRAVQKLARYVQLLREGRLDDLLASAEGE